MESDSAGRLPARGECRPPSADLTCRSLLLARGSGVGCCGRTLSILRLLLPATVPPEHQYIVGSDLGNTSYVALHAVLKVVGDQSVISLILTVRRSRAWRGLDVSCGSTLGCTTEVSSRVWLLWPWGPLWGSRLLGRGSAWPNGAKASLPTGWPTWRGELTLIAMWEGDDDQQSCKDMKEQVGKTSEQLGVSKGPSVMWAGGTLTNKRAEKWDPTRYEHLSKEARWKGLNQDTSTAGCFSVIPHLIVTWVHGFPCGRTRFYTDMHTCMYTHSPSLRMYYKL